MTTSRDAFSAQRKRWASMPWECKVEPSQTRCTPCLQASIECNFDSRDGRKKKTALGDLTNIQTLSRNIVLWACMINDIYWSLYLGRPTMIKASDIARSCLNKDFDSLIHSQPRDHAYIETRVYEALLEIMDLLRPLCETCDTKDPIKPSDACLKIATMDRNMKSWCIQLPERLKWTEDNIRSAPPSFYLLHRQYHTALILFHRSFPTQMFSQRSKNALGSTHFSSLCRKVCVSNAIQVSNILSQYCARFGIQRIFSTALQHIGTAATALMFEISMLQADHGDEARSRLLFALSSLRTTMQPWEEMSEMYQPAALMATIVEHFLQDLTSNGDMDDPDHGDMDTLPQNHMPHSPTPIQSRDRTTSIPAVAQDRTPPHVQRCIIGTATNNLLLEAVYDRESHATFAHAQIVMEGLGWSD